MTITKVEGELAVIGIPGIAALNLDEAVQGVVDEVDSLLLDINLLGIRMTVRVSKENPFAGLAVPCGIDVYEELRRNRDRIVEKYKYL